MGKTILVISSRQDGHIPFVKPHIPTGVEFVIFDPQDLVDGTTLSFSLQQRDGTVLLDGRALDQVISVWYRKPLPANRLKLPIDEKYRTYAITAIQYFVELLSDAFPHAVWMSPFHSIMAAENKWLQLRLAQQLGFNVPETLITSSSTEARAFIDRHKVVITKPLMLEFIQDDGVYAFLARKIDSSANVSGLHLAPSIFQQAITDARDIRVTVIGTQVFAAVITGSSLNEKGSSVRDWRIAHVKEDIQIEPFDLPPRIARLCRTHVQQLGLNYGALDLMVDRRGKFWFLENNPNGQWAFVEDKTRQPMGKALAEFLADPNRS